MSMSSQRRPRADTIKSGTVLCLALAWFSGYASPAMGQVSNENLGFNATASTGWVNITQPEAMGRAIQAMERLGLQSVDGQPWSAWTGTWHAMGLTTGIRTWVHVVADANDDNLVNSDVARVLVQVTTIYDGTARQQPVPIKDAVFRAITRGEMPGGQAPTPQGGPIGTTKATYRPGEPVVVTWTGSPGNPSDWCAIARVGTPDTAWVNWRYTDGQVDGTWDLGALPPGDYEVRMYHDWAGTNDYTVRSRVPFTVTE